jgi:MFS family permease
VGATLMAVNQFCIFRHHVSCFPRGKIELTHPSITRKSFIHDFGLDVMTKAQVTATSSNLTSCFQAAAFFGAAFSWGSMEMYGRKITLLISSIIFVIGSIMQTVAVSQLGLVYAGRSICGMSFSLVHREGLTVTGLAVGGITGVVPAFISEIAPPRELTSHIFFVVLSDVLSNPG